MFEGSGVVMRGCCLLLVVGLLVLGCGGENTGYDFAQSSNEIAEKINADYDAEQGGVPGEVATGAIGGAGRHVIYDADIDLEVADFSVFSKQLPEAVNLCGGYISDVNIDHVQTSRRGVWQARIASGKFDEFILKLGELGEVETFHQKAQDVTGEFVDLQARIVSKKKMESRFLALIDESNRSLKDVIGLEKELARIRSEIERMQGALNQLRNQTEFAKVTIVASENRPPVVAEVVPFGARVSRSWGNSIGLLKSFFQELTVVLVYLVPWTVFVSAVVAPFMAYYFMRHRKATQRRLPSSA